MILVTGAGGNTGREVVAACRALGLPTVAGDRSGRERRFDFTDRATWPGALEGVTQVFLLRPPPISDMANTLNPFVDQALARGVSHVVFLSVQGAESSPRIPHHAVEQHLQRGPGRWTLLRPGFFAQNFGDAYRADVVGDSRVYVPAGAGEVAFVDLRDVGELAARIFADPAPHVGQAYRLTGPRCFTVAQAAALLTGLRGREVKYVPASVPGYLWHLLVRRRLSLMQAVVQTYLHVGLRRGDAAIVDDTLSRLLGHPARDLSDYLRDHAARW